MTVQPLNDDEKARALTLVLFTGRFATMIGDGGFSIVRSLSLLEDVPEPYGSAAARVRAHVEIGHNLSDAMSLESGLFSPFYVRMVRVGEVGGVLEMTLRRAADIIAKEWRLAGRRPSVEPVYLTPALTHRPSPNDWGELTAFQRAVIQLLFCESFGALLSYGVPILTTMDVVRSWLPSTQAARLADCRTDVAAGKEMRIERLGDLPDVISALVARGEEMGTLDSALFKSAHILEHELDARAAFAGMQA